MGFLGDFDLAEEATADAFATAAERWPDQGVPANPADLASEAIRLGRLLAGLMPDEPEVHGLLALMLLGHARHAVAIAQAGDPERALAIVERIAGL